MSTFTTAIASIRQLTQNNDHTEAYIEGCALLGADADHIATRLLAVLAEQRRVMHLSPAANIARHALYEEMMTLAKATIPNAEDFETFYLSF